MLETKKVDYYEIADVDYNLDQCNQKEEILEMLNNSTPKEVKTFNTKKNTLFYLNKNFNVHTFYFGVNNAAIFIATVTGSLCGFFDFLEHIAYYDNQNLMTDIENEGCYQGITVIPLENNKVRFTVFPEDFMSTNKISADIIIDRDVLLSQFRELILMLKRKMKRNVFPYKKDYQEYVDKTLQILDSYLSNPTEFRKNHKMIRHIRVFDIVYKDIDKTWKFYKAIEGDKKCEIGYWEKQKQEGKILDFDFEEDIPRLEGCEEKELEPYQLSMTKNGLIKLIQKYGHEKLANMYNRIEEKNWCYSTETQKWYSTDEEMPMPKTRSKNNIHLANPNYEIIDRNNESEDYKIKCFLDFSKDDEDNEYYLDCRLNFDWLGDILSLDFSYRKRKEIRKGLEKVQNGEYARFCIADNRGKVKMHIWQVDESNIREPIIKVICFEKSRNSSNPYSCDEIFNIEINRDVFVKSFLDALDDIDRKIEVVKRITESADKLKIEKNFQLRQADNFIGDYACVGVSKGAGIINTKGEWSNKAEDIVIWGEEHPALGREMKGVIRKYYYLDNVDGKYFIAQKNDDKKFVMDVNGDIVINSVVDNIYWSKLNNKVYFIFQDDNKSWITDEKGNKLIELDFAVGEKFYLFEDIFICTRDEKFGIVKFKGKNKGKILIDFIFNDIKPPTPETQFIAVKYIDKWGYVNRKGKVLSIKVK